jgi:hypothetical protein
MSRVVVTLLLLAYSPILHSFSVVPSLTDRLKAPTESCPVGRTEFRPKRRSLGDSAISLPATSSHHDENDVRVKDLLSDLPTPTLLLELSLAESALNKSTWSQPPSSLEDYLQNDSCNYDLLDGSLFVHTRVVDTSVRDQINRQIGSGKSLVIAQVDVPAQSIPGGAYLGIGLANHHVGGYYWARGMGMGASLAAHGIGFRESPTTPSNLADDDLEEEIQDKRFEGDKIDAQTMGELHWKKRGPGRNAQETTEESSNSNDGKRSEWADFITAGDTVQLVPYNTSRVLTESPFRRMIGVRRLGRPLGADPIVERIWERSTEPSLRGIDYPLEASKWIAQ